MNVVANKQALTLSIVIPAYNEESHLKGCLDSIAGQLEPPDEVIVVDNNSTDKTAAIARQFPFVRLIKEKRQGVVFARDKGFNATTSDIIGRINADSILTPEWVRLTKRHFEQSKVGAVTGLAVTRTFPFAKFMRTTFWSWTYYIISDGYFRVRILWGGNMALRRNVWEELRNEVWHDNWAHEDQDLSILVAKNGVFAVRDNSLHVYIDGQDFHEWSKFKRYMLMRWHTKAHHRKLCTLQTPAAITLPLWKSSLMHIGMIIPGLLFAFTSIVRAILVILFAKLRLNK